MAVAMHQRAARAVLKSLLPPPGTDLKGHRRPDAELRDASGYARQPEEFDALLRILDTELRLVTPTEVWPLKRIRIQGADCVRPDMLVR